MAAIANYKRAKALSSQYGKMQLKGHLLNGSVYVHYNSANFRPKTDVPGIEKLISQAYQDAAKQVKSAAAKNMGTTELEAAKIISEVKSVVEGKIGSGRTASKIEKGSGLASNKMSSLSEMSFSDISAKARKSEGQMALDANELAKYLEELKKLIDSVKKVPPETMAQIAKAAETKYGEADLSNMKSEDYGYFSFTKNKKTIWHTRELGQYAIKDEFNLIPKSGKANTAMLRLITGYKQLEAIAAAGKGVSKSQIAQANHIMDKFGGLVNTLGTSSQEVTIARGLTTATLLANKELSDFVNKGGFKRTGVKGSAAGETSVSFTNDELPKYYDEMSKYGKKFVSKSDVNIEFRKKGDTGGEFDFNIGLNVKDYKMSQAGTISPTFLGQGNYKDFLIRSGIYKTALEYDLINSIAQKFSKAERKTHADGSAKRQYVNSTLNTNNYKAIKNLVAARTAFSSIAGLGTKKDTAYLIVFTNKVITTHEFFSKMAKPGSSRLQLTITNEDSIFNEVNSFVETPADVNTDAYIRSRRILDISYADFKVKIHGSKMKL